MVRCLKVEFDGHWYSWFDCDDAQISKIQRLPDILRQNVTHYFKIPVADQVIFDNVGRLNSDSDIFRVFHADKPAIHVYDKRRGVCEYPCHFAEGDLSKTNAPMASCSPSASAFPTPNGAMASSAYPITQATTSVEPAIHEVRLIKTPGERFGFTNITCQTALVVSSVDSGGILARWNSQYPDRAVTSGDIILSVNHQTDPQQMREQLQTDDLLLVIRRGASFNLEGEGVARTVQQPVHQSPMSPSPPLSRGDEFTTVLPPPVRPSSLQFADKQVYGERSPRGIAALHSGSSTPPCGIARAQANNVCPNATSSHRHVVRSPSPAYLADNVCSSPSMSTKQPRCFDHSDSIASRHFSECARLNHFSNTWKARREETGNLLNAHQIPDANVEKMRDATHHSLFTAMDEMASRCAKARRADMEALRTQLGDTNFGRVPQAANPGYCLRSSPHVTPCRTAPCMVPALEAVAAPRQSRSPPGRKYDLDKIDRIVRGVVRVLDHDENRYVGHHDTSSNSDNSSSGMPTKHRRGGGGVSKKLNDLRTHFNSEIDVLKKTHQEDYDALKKLILEKIRALEEAQPRRSAIGEVAKNLQNVEDVVANVQLQRSMDVSRLEQLQEELERARGSKDIVRELEDQLQLGGHMGIRELLASQQDVGQKLTANRQFVDDFAQDMETAQRALLDETAQLNSTFCAEINEIRTQLHQKQNVEFEWIKDREEQHKVIGDLVLQLQEQKKLYEDLELRVLAANAAPQRVASQIIIPQRSVSRISQLPATGGRSPININAGRSPISQGGNRSPATGARATVEPPRSSSVEPPRMSVRSTRTSVQPPRPSVRSTRAEPPGPEAPRPSGGGELYVSDGSVTDNAVAEVLNRYGGATIGGKTWTHVSGNTYSWGTRKLWIKASAAGEEPKVRLGGTVTLMSEFLEDVLLAGDVVESPKAAPKAKGKAKAKAAKAKPAQKALPPVESDSDSMDFGANPYAAVM
eukprot:GEMP01001884.1.p1 GENE.GEMP01001884.1~~GEMP01001884.1.p1  ORF type:complete len:979 (+),score=238.45 GEMP01001884.1:194-3130(+)